MWKALNHPILINESNVIRSFSLWSFWILYSKINFEVLYLIEFSIFLEKNKIIECRLFITTLQPLGLAFLNSITKFLIILYFESFSISFYLLFFSYILYNSKCSQLALKNESKEVPPFWKNFHTNVSL